MSSILYYSNFCENSKKILLILSKSDIKNNIHFICIDKRIQKNNKTYVILDNYQEILLPNNITSVPSLLSIKDNYKVIVGENILNYLNPIQNNMQNNMQNNFINEPDSFSMNNNMSGIISDVYSFLDQTTDDLSAKGNGGLRQLYNYSTINDVDRIETPPDDYVPDKIGEVNIKNIESERNQLNYQ